MRKGERWRLIGLVLLFAALVTPICFGWRARRMTGALRPYLTVMDSTSTVQKGCAPAGAQRLYRALAEAHFRASTRRRRHADYFPLARLGGRVLPTQFWTEEDAEYLDGWVQEGVLVLMANDSRLPGGFPHGQGTPALRRTRAALYERHALWNPDWMAGIRSVRMGDFRASAAEPGLSVGAVAGRCRRGDRRADALRRWLCAGMCRLALAHKRAVARGG